MLKNSLDKPRTVAIIRPDQTRPALSLAIFAA